jgi:hypothetical protein
MYPEARSVGAWLKGGWHVAVGYVLGFAVLMLVSGWHPEPLRGKAATLAPTAKSTATSISAPGAPPVTPTVSPPVSPSAYSVPAARPKPDVPPSQAY